MTMPADMDHKRRGGWLPGQDDLEAWIEGHRDRARAHADRPLHPSVAAFRHLFDTDPVIRMGMTRMIKQVPRGKQYRKRHIEDIGEYFLLINEVLTTAPAFSDGGMVTTPFAAILDWTMATPAGFAVYRDPKVNAALKNVLDAWAAFLDSPDSLSVLSDAPGGWKSEKAQQVVGMDQFEYDPDDERWGFTSWNDFFIRRFRDGQRPVASPDDDSVVVSSSESTPYAIATDVQRRDEFWIKRQPYSLEDLLANDESVDRFVGGSVYQAFLSATNYHRWHSPVSGTIVRAFLQPGTYFSEADAEGEDATEPKDSQGYLAHVAARAVIVIEADNTALGHVAVVPVGMIEVSSCVIGDGIVPGAHVTKGDELGYFQFGGSTECLVFEPGAIESFAVQALPKPEDPTLVHLHTQIATAVTGG
ncbi:phosphatidylserine decarboxylase family protein [Curtobacterium sp. SL109]|uniref:phosphatidylserine decarboxylase family protein n=1 Tax=Curtobacterium sp. SL109 TaxID=2994662 RepID=UPI00227401B0|nr:phosphatidylserine decarboxylase family protein [Curtobacterium sp. SL109]MCY1695074.1 phosphatidylserine decarboxylase family protein [Curtobacterium sp. SL109]